MKNLLAFVGGVIVTFAGLGWYLDWYKVKSEAGPAGHHKVNIDFDSAKIADDVQKGVQKGEQKLQSLEKNSGSRADDHSKSPDSVLFLPPNPPSTSSTDPGLYIPGAPGPNQ